MSETHPGILVCLMKGGAAAINIDSIYAVIPDLNKPKSQSVVYCEGMDDGLLVEGVSSDIIAGWSQKLFFRDAMYEYAAAADDDE